MTSLMSSRHSDMQVKLAPREKNFELEWSLTRSLLRNTRLIMGLFGSLKDHTALSFSKDMTAKHFIMISFKALLQWDSFSG
jgi:hypothetical protein